MHFNDTKYIIHYKNNTLHFSSGVQVFIFDYGIENNVDEKYDMQTLIKYVYFIYQLYQKDDNPTPLGKLCDYVAENWENVENMSRSDVLNQFYSSLF